MSNHNRNPKGRNQYGVGLTEEQENTVIAALNGYHREGLVSSRVISQRLYTDHGVNLSISSVDRRRTALGLLGPRKKKNALPDQEKEQYVLQQLDHDPSARAGPAMIKHNLIHDTGIAVSRQFVRDVMHMHAPEGFQSRAPGARRIPRVQKIPFGIHDQWAGDGHDKLYLIGFPIWAMVDSGSAEWLDAWVVPSNRMGHIIGYLFLVLVIRFRGIPLQSTTDCGSETTQLFGLANALREVFHSDMPPTDYPAHVYMRSIHNISIERAWLRLRLSFGDNAVIEFQKGQESGVYNPLNPLHMQLCQWLWAKTLRLELKKFMEKRNTFKSRRDNNKAGPSGCSSHDVFLNPEAYGLKNCLLPLTDAQVKIVEEIAEAMGGESLLEFVSPEDSARFETAYATLNIQNLTMYNAWLVFESLLRLLRN